MGSSKILKCGSSKVGKTIEKSSSRRSEWKTECREYVFHPSIPSTPSIPRTPKKLKQGEKENELSEV